MEIEHQQILVYMRLLETAKNGNDVLLNFLIQQQTVCKTKVLSTLAAPR